MIVIVNYGVGNLSSVKNNLNRSGFVDVIISSREQDLKSASKLILPGVGRFDDAMRKLRSSGLCDILSDKVAADRTPVLGICLGAQLMTNGSEEGGEKGLGWVDAICRRFDGSKMSSPLPVPNMGWADVTEKKESFLMKGMPASPRFYFSHSYEIVCARPEDRLLTAFYGYEFTAAFECENFHGMQFHPEKSHKFGAQLLSNFART